MSLSQIIAEGRKLCDAALEIERDRDELRAEVERWKKRYYDVADAVCAESKDCEDLCRQARETRAEVERLKPDKARLDWLFADGLAAGSPADKMNREAIDAAMKGDE